MNRIESLAERSTGGLLAHQSRWRPVAYRALLASSLLLAACGQSDAAPAGQSKKPTAQRSERVYAVAGVTPGMGASQVVSAAQAAGYRLVGSDEGEDWAAAMKKATTGDRYRLFEKLNGLGGHEFKKGSESLTVDYVAMPSGPVAYLVHYGAPVETLDLQAARQSLTQRYGPSTFSGERWAQWCSKPARSPQECLRSSHLSVSLGNGLVFISAEDAGVREEQKRLLRQLSGAKPTF